MQKITQPDRTRGLACVCLQAPAQIWASPRPQPIPGGRLPEKPQPAQERSQHSVSIRNSTPCKTSPSNADSAYPCNSDITSPITSWLVPRIFAPGSSPPFIHWKSNTRGIHPSCWPTTCCANRLNAFDSCTGTVTPNTWCAHGAAQCSAGETTTYSRQMSGRIGWIPHRLVLEKRAGHPSSQIIHRQFLRSFALAVPIQTGQQLQQTFLVQLFKRLDKPRLQHLLLVGRQPADPGRQSLRLEHADRHHLPATSAAASLAGDALSFGHPINDPARQPPAAQAITASP